MFSPSYITLRIQRLEGSVDLNEVAHFEPPHQDLRCLQIPLFSSLVVKELKSEVGHDLHTDWKSQRADSQYVCN